MSRRLGAALAALALAVAPGCSWGHERLLDASDVIDLKYGAGFGLGAKVEATSFLGFGIGYGVTQPREWIGRHGTVGDGVFLYTGLGGLDVGGVACAGDEYASNILVFEYSALAATFHGEVAFLDWWRFGAEILPGFGHLGLYLNAGELVDLLAGVVGLDPAGDEGEPKQLIAPAAEATPAPP